MEKGGFTQHEFDMGVALENIATRLKSIEDNSKEIRADIKELYETTARKDDLKDVTENCRTCNKAMGDMDARMGILEKVVFDEASGLSATRTLAQRTKDMVSKLDGRTIAIAASITTVVALILFFGDQLWRHVLGG